MANSGCDDYYTVLEKHSSAYEKIDNGYRKAGYWDRTAAFAAGSMYSTVEDLFLWNQALYTDKLLSKKYRDIMFKPFLNNYACGWLVARTPLCKVCDFIKNPFDFVNDPKDDSQNNITAAYHTGGIFGVHAIILRILEKKQCFILMSNTGPVPFDEIIYEIYKILNCPPIAHA